MNQTQTFETLNSINVNDHTEKKEGLTYLSWAWAWGELKKLFPDASYVVERFDNKPYLYDENLGYMVFTSMTVNGQTHDMWLPVMDGSNKAMKNAPYKYRTKYGEKTVNAATMFDINKTIMRCLVKNISMFGLGLYIYAGEDLPESEEPQEEAQKEEKPITKATQKQIDIILKGYTEERLNKMLLHYGLVSVNELNVVQASEAIKVLERDTNGTGNNQ